MMAYQISHGMSMSSVRLVVTHLRIPPTRAACSLVSARTSGPSRPDRVPYMRYMSVAVETAAQHAQAITTYTKIVVACPCYVP
jgi:hypothetical protein